MKAQLKTLGNRPENLIDRDFFGLIKKAEAIEAFKSVQGGDGAPQLARLWIIALSKK